MKAIITAIITATFIALVSANPLRPLGDAIVDLHQRQYDAMDSETVKLHRRGLILSLFRGADEVPTPKPRPGSDDGLPSLKTPPPPSTPPPRQPDADFPSFRPYNTPPREPYDGPTSLKTPTPKPQTGSSDGGSSLSSGSIDSSASSAFPPPASFYRGSSGSTSNDPPPTVIFVPNTRPGQQTSNAVGGNAPPATTRPDLKAELPLR